MNDARRAAAPARAAAGAGRGAPREAAELGTRGRGLHESSGRRGAETAVARWPRRRRRRQRRRVAACGELAWFWAQEVGQQRVNGSEAPPITSLPSSQPVSVSRLALGLRAGPLRQPPQAASSPTFGRPADYHRRAALEGRERAPRSRRPPLLLHPVPPGASGTGAGAHWHMCNLHFLPGCFGLRLRGTPLRLLSLDAAGGRAPSLRRQRVPLRVPFARTAPPVAAARCCDTAGDQQAGGRRPACGRRAVVRARVLVQRGIRANGIVGCVAAGCFACHQPAPSRPWVPSWGDCGVPWGDARSPRKPGGACIGVVRPNVLFFCCQHCRATRPQLPPPARRPRF